MAASAGFGIFFRPSCVGDLVGQRLVDIEQMRDHALADRRRFDLAEFERQSGGDVLLLAHGLADEELPRLAVVVGEAFGAQPALGALFDVSERRETALRRLPAVLRRTNSAGSWRVRPDCAWPYGRPAGNGERAFRRVDRDVGEVRAAEPLQLGIEVGEIAALQQRVVGEVDARAEHSGS